MTALLFISLIFNPFAELEADNEALRCELEWVTRVEIKSFNESSTYQRMEEI